MASKSKKSRTPKKSTSTLPQVNWSLVLKIVANVGVALLAWVAFSAIMQKKSSSSTSTLEPVYECSESVQGYSPAFCGKHLVAFKSVENSNVLMVKTAKPSALDLKSNVIQTLIDISSKTAMSIVHEKIVTSIVERAPQRVLLLGLGGGAIPLLLADRLPECQLVAVDLYQDALTITRKFVLADDGTKIQYVHADAQRYIGEAATESFDIVINDIYQGSYLPEFVLEESFLDQIKRVMRDDAMYIHQVFAPEWATDRVIRSFMALRKAFPSVDFGDAGEKGNFLFLASKIEKPKDPESEDELDDDRASTDDESEDDNESEETLDDASTDASKEAPETESIPEPEVLLQ